MSVLNERQPNEIQSGNFWIEFVKTIIFSLVIAFGIRTFIIEPRYVPSGSMEPTIQPGEHLLIDKLSYDFTSPKRGDIVVFNPTKTLEEDNFHDAFIKRVIGLPGDKVDVKNGQVFINNVPIKENYIEAKPDYTWGPVIVPANSYLVLGDNRNDSFDSHYWGFVPRNKIVGRAIFSFWPFNQIGGIHRPTYNLNTINANKKV
ncbi:MULTISPECIES: signal peptidase I [Nostocales]|uniref:Signal peptidase I n=3 Tax=Nostocales TaxID=1161 RepID=A0A8S9T9N6_9CYAN|nr:signal peptidase I [Tolypothrix bouteillei]KAF3889271.1 signal peptidase I [Tolypothrix bouteillei VB521301]